MRNLTSKLRAWLHSRWGRRLLRSLVIGVLLLLGAISIVLAMAWEGLGAAPRGARLASMEASQQWQDSAFENSEPLWNDTWGMMTETWDRSPYGVPSAHLPVVETDPEALLEAPATGLRVTWLGHSTTLIEMDGVRVLTDPVWGERSSPLSLA